MGSGEEDKADRHHADITLPVFKINTEGENPEHLSSSRLQELSFLQFSLACYVCSLVYIYVLR